MRCLLEVRVNGDRPGIGGEGGFGRSGVPATRGLVAEGFHPLSRGLTLVVAWTYTRCCGDLITPVVAGT